LSSYFLKLFSSNCFFFNTISPLYLHRASKLHLSSIRCNSLHYFRVFIVSLQSLAAKAAAWLTPYCSLWPPVCRSTGARCPDAGFPPPGQQFIMQQRTPKAVWIGWSAGKQTAPDNEFLVCAAFISPLICALAMFAVIANFRV